MLDIQGEKKKRVRSSSVSAEVREGGGVPGTEAEIPLQPMEDLMLEQLDIF